ncbi:MAG: type II toxin-antitoxin system Phd/YefM family antitoxin [Acetobacteraceae bacterium]|nr:type II toxin-antitoxin system Phd/YefM family antitoxin [Acetobacteraceae bacterium]
MRPDEAIRPTPEDEPRLGTEHLPRADIAVLEQSQPRLVDAALRGPVILTRHGRDAFVLLPVDMFSRLARDAEARRLKGPPVIEGQPGEG